jgi:tetratricopeptide (TPR) repeat protein
MFRPAALAALFLAPQIAVAQSTTVIGPPNQLLADGTAALQAGRYEQGVRLTIAGLDLPNNPENEAAAHSNICAGYAALKRWDEALVHCNRALELDRGNWRTFNNRAAVFVGLKKFDLAMTDVNSGLELAPNATILLKSRAVVTEHHQAFLRDRRRRPNKA